ncbi:MAG: dihydrolipoamide acetyltransferase family protein [Dehalococcoidia bacterium]
MATEIVMPQMGAEMEEGTVLKWLKQPGDTVNKGDIIAEIETDKATVELDSFESGTFLKAIIDEGTTVPVGQVIAYLGLAGEAAPEGPAGPGTRAIPSGPAAREMSQAARSAIQQSAPPALAVNERIGEAERTAGDARSGDTLEPARTVNAADTVDPARPAGEGGDEAMAATAPAQTAVGPRDSLRRNGSRVRASPVARSMAEELGVDLGLITGTGPEGRITRRDVEDFARNRAAYQVQGVEARTPVAPEPAPPRRPVAAQVQRPAPGAGPAVIAPSPPAPGLDVSEDEVEPLTRMRQAIARRMATAKREIPHYYVAVSVDMTEALRMRRDLNAQLAEADHIPISPMILKACALALEHQPHFNATFTDQGITVHHAINLGLAVALDDGLVVPAILGCRGTSLGALARAARDVAVRARAGRLRPAELNDGTFTVSNLGMYGVETLVAIIQPGQAAILGVGNVEERAVVREGQVVARSMMTVALSADHRVTDGAQGAQFLAEIKTLLEHPAQLVL